MWCLPRELADQVGPSSFPLRDLTGEPQTVVEANTIGCTPPSSSISHSHLLCSFRVNCERCKPIMVASDWFGLGMGYGWVSGPEGKS